MQLDDVTNGYVPAATQRAKDRDRDEALGKRERALCLCSGTSLRSTVFNGNDFVETPASSFNHYLLQRYSNTRKQWSGSHAQRLEDPFAYYSIVQRDQRVIKGELVWFVQQPVCPLAVALQLNT